VTPEQHERRTAASLDAIALVEAAIFADDDGTRTILDAADPRSLRCIVAALCDFLAKLADPPDSLLAVLASWRGQVLETEL
jgi:hypothetical protein